MARRKMLSKRANQRNFARTASKVNPVNGHRMMRGGTRL